MDIYTHTHIYIGRRVLKEFKIAETSLQKLGIIVDFLEMFPSHTHSRCITIGYSNSKQYYTHNTFCLESEYFSKEKCVAVS